MYSNRTFVILCVLAVSILVLSACDQGGSGGHMMSGGMMGGGMMGQMPTGNSGQPVPEQQSKAAQSYQHYCAQCHALPATTAHTAHEWPGVVGRMREHMLSQNKTVPDNEELGQIIDYLQRHAG
jgi:hypothetical protein